MRRLALPVGCTTLAVVVACALALAVYEDPGVLAQTTGTPNIVFVLLDDLDARTMNEYMPRSRALIKNGGISFEKATYATPLCCPSRATIQRGQYPHNTRVMANNPPEGGFQTFLARDLQRSTYATWLNDAGYRTGYFGKYMNGYEKYQGKNRGYRPPGWDRWFAAAAGPTQHLYNSNGRIVQTERMRRTTFDATVARYGIRWIDDASRYNAPFLAALNFYAPHYPAEHPGSLDKMYRAAQLPDDPSFSEADVTDKPRWVASLDGVGPRERAALTAFHRDRLRSVEFVDRQIERLVDVLDARGELDNTYIFVWSDNGFHLGQHRLPSQTNGGKLSPYTHDVEVPLWVRVPRAETGLEQGSKSDALVSNVDLAPTFAEIADVRAPDFVDGRSFLPLLRGQQVPYREFVYLQGNSSHESPIPMWREIRTRTRAYHYYPETDEEELYDLQGDPYQLDNVLKSSAAETGGYRELVRQMGGCERQGCRDIEMTQPPQVTPE